MIEIRKYNIKTGEERICTSTESEEFSDGNISRLNKLIPSGFFWGVRVVEAKP